MKLRIQGNSLRFRLTQKEVACLHDSGRVESAVRFPTGRDLRYVIECSPDAIEVSVDYACNSICVLLPHGVATTWAESSQVSIVGSRHPNVEVLIEKDFKCLHKPAERDPDAYPHPLEARPLSTGYQTEVAISTPPRTYVHK
jgi:hypothetical protein